MRILLQDNSSTKNFRVQQHYFIKILFTGSEVLYDQLLTVEHGIVISLMSIDALHIPAAAMEAHLIAPAFIDLQIYGAGGKLFSMYPSPDTLRTMYEHGLKGGTSDFLVTVATNSLEVIMASVDAIKAYWNEGGKGVIGLHLEGPWINKSKRGAHLEKFIKVPETSEVLSVLNYGKGVIKMITLAPEMCSDGVLQLIKSFDISISAGHSNASFEEARSFFSKGISTVTHLFNAMSAFHHRDTGLPGATFEHPSVMSSIIVDGFHVDYSAVKIAKKLMGDRLFLITDAVTETKEGPYQHTFDDGRYTSSGTLSGSALTMIQAVKNCITHCGIPDDEAFRMGSLYPANLLNLEAGKITINQKASFIILDENLEVLDTCT